MLRSGAAILMTIFIMQSCSHIATKPKISQPNYELYSILKEEIISAKALQLKECNCLKALYRDLFAKPDMSSRYVFDELVGEHAIELGRDKDSVSVLVIGAGTLLNELTALANILAQGKSVHIYLNEWAYLFYGDADFEEKALKFGKNPETLPEGWQGFYFWPWAKNQEKPYLPFFKQHHQAIDQFKAIIANLDQIYHTQSTVDIIKPAADKAVKLPKLDMIISVDSFIDVPALIWNLFYQLKLTNNPVRFIALNKTKPLGGFWESPDLTLRESNSLKPVSIDIYDISSTENYGSYNLVERRVFNATEEQIKKAPEFKTDPKLNSTQSPLDKR